MSLSPPTSRNDFFEKSLNEHAYDVAAADCVLLYNVEKRPHNNLGEKAVREILNTVKFSSNAVVRTNRLSITNSNKNSKPRSFEVKLTNNDKNHSV